MQRGRLKGIATRGAEIAFGTYALKAVTRGYITSKQIEAARKAIVRKVRRGWKIWIRIFPDKPYTMKALGLPMGWGKWSVEMFRAPVKPGRILFEIAGVSEEDAREAFRVASYKLPVKTKVLIHNTEGYEGV